MYAYRFTEINMRALIKLIIPRIHPFNETDFKIENIRQTTGVKNKVTVFFVLSEH